MWTLVAVVGLAPVQAQERTVSVSLLGGGYFAHSEDVFGDAGALSIRAAYWYVPELGVEVDVPFAFAGRMRTDEPRESWGGMLPNIGVLGRFWSEQPVSVLLGASLGASLRSVAATDPDTTGNLDADFAVLAGPGVLVRLTDDLTLRGEWRGVLNVGGFGGRPDLGEQENVLLNGMLMAGFGYHPSGPADADKDGVADDADACVSAAEDLDGFEDLDGCPDPDNDGDGLLDGEDRCPDAVEDLDGFQDDDGCPDIDNDADGVTDPEDRCPLDNGEAALAGCPDADGDGVADLDDECPEEAGSPSAFGCLDRDGDRVPDARDACPDDPSPTDVDARRDDGCPRNYYITEDAIVILEQVQFLTASATIQRRSYSLLDGVAQVLLNNPGVSLVRIEGHSDNSGSEDTNLRLSQKRAESVKTYLEAKGITSDRLVAKGFGESQPIADNGTSEGRKKNRRVAFEIVEQQAVTTPTEPE